MDGIKAPPAAAVMPRWNLPAPGVNYANGHMMTIIAFLAVSLSLRIAGAELRPIGTCEKRNPPQDREPEITDDPDQVETRPRRIRHRHLS